jgi:twitching motility protein PilT
MAAIDTYLTQVLEKKGSDLHFLAGGPARVRQYGELKPLSPEPLAPTWSRARSLRNHAEDFGGALRGQGRLRFRLHHSRRSSVSRQCHAPVERHGRHIPNHSLQGTHGGGVEAARVRHESVQDEQRLILVTGKTGSGKSTTLAAMVDDINTREKGHILTIEDPIEFVHTRKQCLISQREIGVHAASFSAALMSALREDPDVILVGELRDLETMSIAVSAAEMGILVMGTLHTNGAAATVDRLVNAFPADKQPHVRTMLSTSLRGVVSQQLIPTADKRPGGGLEILINTPRSPT